MTPEMTVRQLKRLLADIPDETLVILSQDSEGNTMSPAIAYSAGLVFVPGGRRGEMGEIYPRDDPGARDRRAKAAFVLWPAI